MKIETTLPRANAELAAEYSELMEKYAGYDFSLSYEESQKLEKRISELHDSYDWNNYEFTDLVTGKKGVKDVTGLILVPACYDGFSFIGSFQLGHDLPKAAIRDNKYGFVAGDGSGKELTPFIYNSLIWDPQTCLFQATWGKNDEISGYVTPHSLLEKKNNVKSNKFICFFMIFELSLQHNK